MAGIQRSRQFSGSSHPSRNPFHDAGFQKMIRRGPICGALLLLVTVPLVLVNVVRTSLEGEEVKFKFRDTMGGYPRADTAPYTGTLWKTEQTLGKTPLGQTKFARCDVHSVMSADQKSIINDWIFLEERDHINALVYTKDEKFLVFEQRKYAIPGETLSPVGGFINDGETPFDAARREVAEELGVGSEHTLELLKWKKSSAIEQGNAFNIPMGDVILDEHGIAIGNVPVDEQKSWVFLGRYRTAANRGGGFLYSYLLLDAVPVAENGGTAEYVRRGDDEEQKLLSLSKDQVVTALANADFQEVKWTATISLSLLYMDKHWPNLESNRIRIET